MQKWLRNILIVLAFAAALPAHAQLAGQADPVQYIVASETPGPHEPVVITVQGVGSFLGDATLTWRLNGVVAKQGTGASTYTFTTGALGQESDVRLTINSPTQGSISHTFTFNPSTVDLVWEADTSVPPLYRGHALYSAGSDLTVVAFPTVVVGGKKIAAQSLSYQWTLNDNPAPQSSGTGKYIFSFTGDQLNQGEDVSVDVYLGSQKVGYGEVTIPVSQPKLLLYNKDALRGVVWDRALPAAISLAAKEITVQAQPYFFSTGALLDGSLGWTWTLDDSPITGPYTSQGLLTLRQTGTTQGSANLTVAVQNNSDTQLIQSAQAALQLVFGQTTSSLSSFFGL